MNNDDMRDIKMFIRCSKEPDNELFQEKVFNYYIRQADIYWNELTKYIYDSKTESVRINNNLFVDEYILKALDERTKYRIENYNNFKQGLMNDTGIQKEYPIPSDWISPIEKKIGIIITLKYYDYCYDLYHIADYWVVYNPLLMIREDFNRTAQDNFALTRKYSYIFKLISNLFSFTITLYPVFSDSYKTLDYTRLGDKTFLLTNITGKFSINGYLEGFTQEIILLGIPLGDSDFDGGIDCSKAFFDHDVNHSFQVIEKYMVKRGNDYVLN